MYSTTICFQVAKPDLVKHAFLADVSVHGLYLRREQLLLCSDLPHACCQHLDSELICPLRGPSETLSPPDPPWLTDPAQRSSVREEGPTAHRQLATDIIKTRMLAVKSNENYMREQETLGDIHPVNHATYWHSGPCLRLFRLAAAHRGHRCGVRRHHVRHRCPCHPCHPAAISNESSTERRCAAVQIQDKLCRRAPDDQHTF